mmetsp:Transcript_12924/g.30738  ORF Transcript_12924/g.30738 Transcript_12924/m.30738 type:complete len:241 (-) Transcript_12924:512-1234(-)
MQTQWGIHNTPSPRCRTDPGRRGDRCQRFRTIRSSRAGSHSPRKGRTLHRPLRHRGQGAWPADHKVGCNGWRRSTCTQSPCSWDCHCHRHHHWTGCAKGRPGPTRRRWRRANGPGSPTRCRRRRRRRPPGSSTGRAACASTRPRGGGRPRTSPRPSPGCTASASGSTGPTGGGRGARPTSAARPSVCAWWCWARLRRSPPSLGRPHRHRHCYCHCWRYWHRRWHPGCRPCRPCWATVRGR